MLGWKITQLAEYKGHWKGSCPGKSTMQGFIGMGLIMGFILTGSKLSESEPMSKSKVLLDPWWCTKIKLSIVLIWKNPEHWRCKIWVFLVVCSSLEIYNKYKWKKKQF